jgi:ADP-ribose pyrophosphatase YjhB (NUDIX family)
MDSGRYAKIRCTNCGKLGHTHSVCRAPITSYGVLALSVNTEVPEDLYELINYLSSITHLEQNINITCDSLHILENFTKYKHNIKTLLIRRKHSLGYTEFVRGRYSPSNPNHVAFLFKQMIPAEIEIIKTKDFDYLWADVWSIRNAIIKNDDYMTAFYKYQKLKNNAQIKLIDFINNITPENDCPEWGLPKGRRERDEPDLKCAIREFEEETGYTKNDYILFNNIEPLIENLTGTNGLKYRHVYYIALLTTNTEPHRDDNIVTQRQEIGDIGLFDIDTTIQKIRQYHTERRSILFSTAMNVMNFLILSNEQHSESSDG